MPHKVYHGKTGVVYNVTRHALGVVVNKRIKNRVLPKKINIRVEHLKHSKSRSEFLAYVFGLAVRHVLFRLMPCQWFCTLCIHPLVSFHILRHHPVFPRKVPHLLLAVFILLLLLSLIFCQCVVQWLRLGIPLGSAVTPFF